MPQQAAALADRVRDGLPRPRRPGAAAARPAGAHPLRHGRCRPGGDRAGERRHLGADVYATAGTAAKRERLRELGVAAAFDSHSYRWYDELMAATGGEGVDVVLNSLAGQHIALCLRALRPGGWHCEIGKVDIYADAALGLSVFRKNLRFAAIDVDRLEARRPGRTAELTPDCLRLLGGRAPCRRLPVTAFRFGSTPTRCGSWPAASTRARSSSSRRHGGRAARRLTVTDRRPFLDPEATYLVTGGFGGVGQPLPAYLMGRRPAPDAPRPRPGRRRDAAWVRHASGIAHFFPGADVQHRHRARGRRPRCADVDRVVAGLTRPLQGRVPPRRVLDDHQLADITPESVATRVRGLRRAEHGTCTRRRGGAARPLRPAVVARRRRRVTPGRPCTRPLTPTSTAWPPTAGQPRPARAGLQHGRGRGGGHGGPPAARAATHAGVGHAAGEPGRRDRGLDAALRAAVGHSTPVTGAGDRAAGDRARRWSGDGDHLVCAASGSFRRRRPPRLTCGPAAGWRGDPLRSRTSADGGTGLTAGLITGELCREIGRAIRERAGRARRTRSLRSA